MSEPVFRIPETIREDTGKFKENLKQFLAGDLSAERFKGYRVPMGIYGQRGDFEAEKYMVRVRIPGGFLTEEQFKLLGELSREYGVGYLHFTTRQDIQLHQIEIDDSAEILDKLLQAGLSPRGGGGNTVRNIMNSPAAGVDPVGRFDTTAHCLALSEYLLADRSSFNLPRKYKIAFSVSHQDQGLATINDLGFIATLQDGRRGFKVYAAGGMGNQPAVAFKLLDFVAEDEIFAVAEAIKRLFDRYGDRSNRHQARLRFVRRRFGEDKFKELFLEYFNEVKAEAEAGELKFTDLDYYKNQIESGKAADVLNLNPLNGDLKYQEVMDLIQLLQKYNLSVRTTNKQGLLLRGVKQADLEALKEDLAAVNQNLLDSEALSAVACKGASTCRLGLCHSPNLAEAIRENLLEIEQQKRESLPQIYISGCPNSCGQHHIGKIGFEGKARRENGRLIPYYSLLLGAKVSEENTYYAKKAVDLPAKRIPAFLVELAEKLAAAEDYSLEQFNDYLETGGREEIIQLAQKYTEIPAYSTEADFYQDWGQNEDFSLAGRGPGECGTGVLEIVRLDLDQAGAAYEKGTAEDDSDSLYQAIIAAARSLLIIRGVDTEKDRVIIKEFKKKFIAEDWVAASKEELLEQALDYRLGDQEELLSLSSEIKDLIDRLEALFNSLNSSLEFTIKKLTAVKNSGAAESVETESVSKNSENDKAAAAEKKKYRRKDLRGVQCPINFVKAKLFLEPLPAGEIVDFYLDEGEPIKNVPRSLENEDHKILKNEKQPEGHYLLRVKKAEDN